MELDGHPTHDLVGELEARGASLYQGTGAGPDPWALELQPPLDPFQRGLWLYLPPEVYNTGFDEPPPLT
jgi:hypothetical protein